MSYIERSRIQCDQCLTEIRAPFQDGVIVLQEITFPVWHTFHFHNLEELRVWVPDAEQFINPRTRVVFPEL